MKNSKFLENYYSELKKEISKFSNQIHLIEKVTNLLKKTKSSGKKVIIYGNGGSASAASHFSTDLTKNARIKCINFNESNLITCFSNDYGFENFVAQAIKEFGQKGDLVILVSVSGESKNLIKAAEFCKKNKIKIVTLTGKNKNNSLMKKNKKGINLFIDSKSYNIVEICHLSILLSLVDIIIGKKVYDTSIGKLSN